MSRLSERGITTNELKAGIRTLLEDGEEYSATEMSVELRMGGRDASARRIANAIKDMLGIDRRMIHSPVKGCRLYYAYRKDNSISMA